jgi:hypothetical protein
MIKSTTFGSIVLTLTTIASISYADTWSKLGFHGSDDRLYTGDGDWFYGYTKGECGGSRPIMAGVSTGFDYYYGYYFPYADAILCASTPNISVNFGAGQTLNSAHGDDRLDTSWGDWAPNMVKMECGATEVMTGLAQATGSPGAQIIGARCSPANIHGATNCAAEFFQYGDAQEQPSRGDWDYGYQKGECSPGRYVKGVARFAGVGSYGIAGIFCCSPF